MVGLLRIAFHLFSTVPPRSVVLDNDAQPIYATSSGKTKSESFPELLAIVKDVVKRANGGDTGAAAQQ